MRIREATLDDAPGIARVHVDTWRTAYPGIIPAAHLAQLSYERSEARWRDHLATGDGARFVYVAEDAGCIIGLASGGPERDGLSGYDGELYGLYVLAEFQRHGVGRALLQVVARRLAAGGFKAMVIWVLKENVKARAFYEALGGVLIHEKQIVIGGIELVDVAYGWLDIRTVIPEAKQRDGAPTSFHRA
jgi:GNAT superfamily N-acetyltransferase